MTTDELKAVFDEAARARMEHEAGCPCWRTFLSRCEEGARLRGVEHRAFAAYRDAGGGAGAPRLQPEWYAGCVIERSPEALENLDPATLVVDEIDGEVSIFRAGDPAENDPQ